MNFKMVRSDIFGALRNAIERGESLEEAKSSLVNAGYPAQDVEEAAGAMLVEGNEERLPVIKETNLQMPQTAIPSPIQQAAAKENAFGNILETVKKDKMAIILGGVFFLLIAGLAATYFLMK